MKLIQLIFLIFPSLISTEPIILTDKTWREMLCGQWMVEFYAPWCPSCQHFQPVWKDFSDAMMPKEVKVAAIDIDQYPSMSGRFVISVLPTIYYVRDGVFRQFKGERSLEGLKKFIELEEWQKVEPVSSYIAPDSVLMSIIGKIFDVSLWVKDAYTILQENYGLPSWLIYVALSISVIVVGLILGFGVLMLIDYCLTGFSKDETNYIPDDSRDAEDSDDEEDKKLINSKRSPKNSGLKPKSFDSSTPQRKDTTKSKKIQTASPQESEDFLDELLKRGAELQAEKSESEDEEESIESDKEEENQETSTNNANVRRRKKN